MALGMGVLVSICPVKFNSPKFGTLQICGDCAMFLYGLLKIMGVAFTNIFITKVIDDNNENKWAPFVAPYPGSCGHFIVTGFFEAFAENII